MHKYHRDGCVIMTVEVIKSSRDADSTPANVRRDTLLIDLLKSMVSYAHAFETKYGVSFSDVRFNCNLDDLILPNFLS